MDQIREAIKTVSWMFPPFSEKGKVIHHLIDQIEGLLRSRRETVTSEKGIREEIDSSLFVSLLAWADLLEEQDDMKTAVAMRWLARNNKMPGNCGGSYRWQEQQDRYPPASWSLPKGVSVRERFASLSGAILGAARALSQLERNGELVFSETKLEGDSPGPTSLEW